MKKHLLFSLCTVLLLTLSSSAQVFSKKDRLFGASVGASFNNNSNVPSVITDSRSSNIGLIPSFAWAIKNNMAAGIKAGITYNRYVSENGIQKNIQSSLQIGPAFFIRKYKPLVKNFGVSFTHELMGYYYKAKNKTGSDIVKGSSWGTGYSFVPAAFYKFSDKFIGEANFGGVFLNYNKGETFDNWSAAANFLTYFNIGVQFIIRSKKV